MLPNPKLVRKNLRLKTYDYSSAGTYFITICAYEKKCLFGKIIDDKMMLSGMGEVVDKWWRELKNKFPNIELDQYIIMPNHFHGIINVGADLCVGPLRDLSMVPGNGPTHKSAPTISRMVQWFKTMTTN